MMASLIEQIQTRLRDTRQRTASGRYWPGQPALFPPAMLCVVEAAERQLGFQLPPLLSQLYLRVANGGFGPGYGIFGLEGGFANPFPVLPDSVDPPPQGYLTDWYISFWETGLPELDFYRMSDNDPTLFIDPEPKQGSWTWFDKLLPIADHGCWQLACIDCSKADFPVYSFDGQQCLLQLESQTFDDWMVNWLHSTA